MNKLRANSNDNMMNSRRSKVIFEEFLKLATTMVAAATATATTMIATKKQDVSNKIGGQRSFIPLKSIYFACSLSLLFLLDLPQNQSVRCKSLDENELKISNYISITRAPTQIGPSNNHQTIGINNNNNDNQQLFSKDSKWIPLKNYASQILGETVKTASNSQPKIMGQENVASTWLSSSSILQPVNNKQLQQADIGTLTKPVDGTNHLEAQKSQVEAVAPSLPPRSSIDILTPSTSTREQQIDGKHEDLISLKSSLNHHHHHQQQQPEASASASVMQMIKAPNLNLPNYRQPFTADVPNSIMIMMDPMHSLASKNSQENFGGGGGGGGGESDHLGMSTGLGNGGLSVDLEDDQQSRNLPMLRYNRGLSRYNNNNNNNNRPEYEMNDEGSRAALENGEDDDQTGPYSSMQNQRQQRNNNDNNGGGNIGSNLRQQASRERPERRRPHEKSSSKGIRGGGGGESESENGESDPEHEATQAAVNEQEAAEASEAEAANKKALAEQQQAQQEIIKQQAASEAKAIKQQQEALLNQQRIHQQIVLKRQKDLEANQSLLNHGGPNDFRDKSLMPIDRHQSSSLNGYKQRPGGADRYSSNDDHLLGHKRTTYRSSASQIVDGANSHDPHDYNSDLDQHYGGGGSLSSGSSNTNKRINRLQDRIQYLKERDRYMNERRSYLRSRKGDGNKRLDYAQSQTKPHAVDILFSDQPDAAQKSAAMRNSLNSPGASSTSGTNQQINGNKQPNDDDDDEMGSDDSAPGAAISAPAATTLAAAQTAANLSLALPIPVTPTKSNESTSTNIAAAAAASMVQPTALVAPTYMSQLVTNASELGVRDNNDVNKSSILNLDKTDDLQAAAQHQYGAHFSSLKKHQSHYYQFIESHKKGQFNSGFKRGNKKFQISGHSSQHKGHAEGHIKWHDKKGKGVHYWNLNHTDKKHGYGHH